MELLKTTVKPRHKRNKHHKIAIKVFYWKQIKNHAINVKF